MWTELLLRLFNRFIDGYGISARIVQELYNEDVKLIITVDNGSSAYEALEKAKELGVKVIVLDHHVTQKNLEIEAFVNPHRVSNNRFHNLCAAGIVFIFLYELNAFLLKNKFIKQSIPVMSLIDIVALATICDVVPLIGLNRGIVYGGLKKMQENPSIGINALLGQNKNFIDTTRVGFSLGPLINAPGRFGVAEKSVELLTSKTSADANRILAELVSFNTRRKEIEQEIYNEILITGNLNGNILVFSGKDWHEGVLGIIASKMKDKFQKPVCIVSYNEKVAKGSFRTISGLHVGDFIKTCIGNGLIDFGGGHEMAGGFSLAVEKLEKFEEFARNFSNFTLNSRDPSSRIDCVMSLSAISEEFYNNLSQLAPFGAKNPEPLILFPNCLITFYKILKGNCILLNISNSSMTKNIQGVIFNVVGTSLEVILNKNKKVHIIAHIRPNLNNKLQLFIIDAIEANEKESMREDNIIENLPQ